MSSAGSFVGTLPGVHITPSRALTNHPLPQHLPISLSTVNGADVLVMSLPDNSQKFSECIYQVSISYADSSVVLFTGPPGVEGRSLGNGTYTPAGQRCWVLTKDSDTILGFNRNAPGALCPEGHSTGEWTGFIEEWKTSTPPAEFAPACPAADGAAILAGLSVAGPDFWAQPNFAAATALVGGGLDGYAVQQFCITNLDGLPKMEPAGSITANIYAGGECWLLRLSLGSGFVTLEPNTPCSLDFSGTAKTFSVAFNGIPSALAGLLPPPSASAPSVYASSLVTQSRTVVSTTITLSPVPSSFDVALAAQPCVVFGLRSNLAASTRSDVTNVKLSHFAFGGRTIQVAMDSPGNLLTAWKGACPGTGARRLKEARILQPIITLEAGVSVIAPAGANVAAVSALSTSVSDGGESAGKAFASGAGINGATLTVVVAPVTSAVANVLVVPTYPARVNPYSPSADILMFHSIPRVQGTNKFEATREYATGAIAPAAGLVALGVIFLLLYECIYVCSACCRGFCPGRYPKRDPETWHTGCRKTCSTPRAMIVMALLNVGLILAVLAYLPRFGRGIDNVFGAAADFTNLFGTTGKLLVSNSNVAYSDGTQGPSIFSSATAAYASAQTLLSQSSSAPAAIRDLLTSLRDGTGDITTIATSAGNSATSAGNQFKSSLDSVPLETVKMAASIGGFIILGSLSFILLAFSLLVCKNSFASCLYKALAPITIILVALISILAAVFYAFGIIGADVCYDPSTTLITLMNSTISSGPVLSTVAYYLTCGANPAQPTVGTYNMILTAQTQLQMAAAQAVNLGTAVSADTSNSAYVTLAVPVNSGDFAVLRSTGVSMTQSAAAMGTIATTTLSCTAIDPILSRLFEGLCNDGFGTVIGIARILIAAAVLLICQLGVGIDICCYHPGDKSAWVSDEDRAARAGLPDSSGAAKSMGLVLGTVVPTGVQVEMVNPNVGLPVSHGQAPKGV